MSGRRKEAIKKKTIVKIVAALAIAAAVITVGMEAAREKVAERFGSNEIPEATEATVTRGSVSTTVSGTGTLADQEAEATVIPQAVDVTEIYVKQGDNVEQGQILAAVNSASVVQAMADVQKQLDSLDTSIASLTDADADDTIAAGVAGRVKEINIAVGEAVSNAMYEKQALMVLSTDGYMAVDLQLGDTVSGGTGASSDEASLQEGDPVSVTTSSGKSYTGTVDQIWAGKATILITDNGPENGDKVTIQQDKKSLGEGNLYIHQPLQITGYTGKVKAVKVSLNEAVKKNKTLLTLTDTTNTMNYASLLKQRAELEDTLHDLMVIYKEGAVYAGEKGRVTEIVEAQAASAASTAVDTSISICPTDEMTLALTVDETDILAVQAGQSADVTVSALGDTSYQGTVTDINTTGSSSSGVTTFTVNLTLEKAEGMLNGMSASAVIRITGKDDVLMLPTDAIHQTSSSAYVYTTFDENTGEFGGRTEILTGLSNGKYTEIEEGLAEGDKVYYIEKEEVQQNWKGNRGNRNSGESNGGGRPSGDFPSGDFPSGNFPSGGSGNAPSGMPDGSGKNSGNRTPQRPSN